MPHLVRPSQFQQPVVPCFFKQAGKSGMDFGRGKSSLANSGPDIIQVDAGSLLESQGRHTLIHVDLEILDPIKLFELFFHSVDAKRA